MMSKRATQTDMRGMLFKLKANGTTWTVRGTFHLELICTSTLTTGCAIPVTSLKKV